MLTTAQVVDVQDKGKGAVAVSGLVHSTVQGGCGATHCTAGKACPSLRPWAQHPACVMVHTVELLASKVCIAANNTLLLACCPG